MGVLAMLGWVLTHRSQFADHRPDGYLPYLYVYWAGVACVGYGVSYGRAIITRLDRGVSWPDLEVLLLGGALALWCWWPVKLEIPLVALVGYALLSRVRTGRSYPMTPFSWACIALAIVPWLGLLWGESWPEGRSKASMLLLVGCSAVATRYIRIPRERVWQIFTVVFRFVIAILVLQILCYLCLAYFYGGGPLTKCFTFEKLYNMNDAAFLYFMPWTHTTHPTFWSYYLGIVLILGYYIHRRYGWLSRIEIGNYWLLMLIFCFIEQPRYGFALVGLVAGVIAVVELKPWLSIRLLIGGLIALVMGFVGLLVLYRPGFLYDPLRQGIYADALEALIDALPWGYGTGADTMLHIATHEQGHSHNAFLTAGIDHGLLGIGVLLVWLGLGLWQGWRERNAVLCTALLLLIPLLLIDTPFYTRAMTYLVALYVFLGTSLASAEPRLPSSTNIPHMVRNRKAYRLRT